MELAYEAREEEGRPKPLIIQKPQPNCRALARACAKNEYSLIKPLVDFGFRMKAFQFGTREEKKHEIRVTRNLVQFSANKDVSDTTSFVGSENDDIMNLRVLELSVKSSYLVACYKSLAEKQKHALEKGGEICECYYKEQESSVTIFSCRSCL